MNERDITKVSLQFPYVSESLRRRVTTTTQLPTKYGSKHHIRAHYAKRRLIQAANLKKMYDAGVKILMGTDAGNPLTFHGPSIWEETERMQAAGMSPSDVLRASTSTAAEALGRSDDLGQLKPGYKADIVVLTHDPSNDISALRTVESVIKGGYLHRQQDLLVKLDEMK